MLTPYLLHSTVVPSACTSGVDASQWASPMFRLCATTHTSNMVNQIPFMTCSEHLLLQAIEDTTKEICRVITKMWANGVTSGLDTVFPVELNGEPDITHLMHYWSVWIKCRPACSPEEMCYLTTWPINALRSERPPPSPRTLQNLTDTSEAQYFADTVGFRPKYPTVPAEDRGKPQPMCIGRLQAYGF
ncbi:hypothetical protein EDB19DRAFT_1749239 [Suillus lakei]|nr:hypothetical protein EDB19DRAFT_1749239 [Suillus lakei]